MTAKIFGPDSVQTFDEFEQSALRLAGVLRDLGIGAGDRVLLKAGNSTAWLGTFFALMHVGSSIVLVDQQEHADETRRIALLTGVKVVLVDEDAPITADLDPTHLYELLVAAAGREVTETRLSLEEWGDRSDGLIMWTSGSTGTPKGIVKSGRKFLKNLERNAAQVGHHSDDVLLPLLPFPHQYGLSMVLIAWLARCSLVIAPHRRLDRALRVAGDTGSTVIDATPASYRSIMNLVTRKPELRRHLASVRMFCVGAAPLDAPLVDRYVAEFGLPLLDSYGSTELGNVAFATSENPTMCGTATEGISLRIVDEQRQPLPAGEVGEIEVDTPDGMEGHLDADGILHPAVPGWQRTGDLGLLDAHGNLTVLGRKFAVTRMGYTLYLEPIERKAALAGVSTRVVALPDERSGAYLMFFVEDEDGRDQAYWRDLLHEALPVYERPNRVVVLDRFPLNRNGKPDKKQLEKLAHEHRDGTAG